MSRTSSQPFIGFVRVGDPSFNMNKLLSSTAFTRDTPSASVLVDPKDKCLQLRSPTKSEYPGKVEIKERMFWIWICGRRVIMSEDV